MTAGESHPPVEKTKEAYTAKIVYQDSDAKSRRHRTHKFNTLAGFNAGVHRACSPLRPSRPHTAAPPPMTPMSETFSATLKCHDPNGELYLVNFSRGPGHPHVLLG